MKNFLALLLVIASAGLASAQGMEKDEEGFHVFQMKDGDSTFFMKQYFFVMLKEGPNRDQKPEEANVIQKEHLKHMSNLAKEGKLMLAGPFGDESQWKGIVFLNVKTLEEAKALTDQDPAVKAGRLVAEIHPLWAAKGSTLK
jgi:uncharacterized protein YciI